jgi:isopenicillin N synthase-like dioxygenase
MGTLLPESRRLDFSEVPVVDISALVDDDRERLPSTVDAIRAACSQVGFMYVTNHRVRKPIVDAVAEQTRRFFALPAELKADASMAKSTQFRGWIGMKQGGTKSAINHREGFVMRAERPTDPAQPLDGSNIWPTAVPEFKTAMETYFAEVEALSKHLMRGFSLALGLSEDALAKMFDHSTTQLKLNYYPAQERPENETEIGLVAHTDSGGFTILWQDDVGGLETVNGRGEWVVVPPIADTFVINIGDQLQAWSNGRFPSTPHRVINRYGVNRYSIPLFVNPNYHTWVRPLVGEVPDGYVPFLSGAHQAATYDRLYPRAAA